MKKSTSIIVGVIVIVVVIAGYFLIHKPKTEPKATSTTTKTTAVATGSGVLVVKTSSSLGKYYTDPNGKALYTYGNDTSGVSNCTGSCLTSWPAYVDGGSTSNLPTGVGTIKRKDNGQIQYTYDGLPLYYFAGDSNGQVTGNGVSSFKVAVPATSTQPSGSSTANPY